MTLFIGTVSVTDVVHHVPSYEAMCGRYIRALLSLSATVLTMSLQLSIFCPELCWLRGVWVENDVTSVDLKKVVSARMSTDSIDIYLVRLSHCFKPVLRLYMYRLGPAWLNQASR